MHLRIWIHAGIAMLNRRGLIQGLTAIAGVGPFGACTGSPHRLSKGTYVFVNAVRDYANLLSGAASETDILPRFTAEILEPNREAYSFTDMGAKPEAATLEAYIKNSRSDERRYRDLSVEFPRAFQDHWNSFRAVLPELSGESVFVYFLPGGLNDVGGSVRQLDGRDFVVVGSDIIALLNRNSSVALSTFVHHELAHLYHGQVNPEIRKAAARHFLNGRDMPNAYVYQLMWLEGFAAYVSQALNPLATNEHIFVRERFAKMAQDRLSVLVENSLEKMDESDPSTIWALVFNGDRESDVPPRSGYYIGMQVAKVIGSEMSLSQLARLQGEELRQGFYDGLRQILAGKH